MSEQLKLAIIGSGPAGYTAGIYASRAQLAPTIFAGLKSGGQLVYTTDVENFPGFKDGKNGPELMMDMRAQAEKFGAVVKDQFIFAVDLSARPFKLWNQMPDGISPDIFEHGQSAEIAKVSQRVRAQEPSHTAEAVIISTGAVANFLNIPGERELLGKGVSVCAVCDAAFFRDQTAMVIGGGDSAMEDALALTKFASKVYIAHRRDSFKASQIMQDRVLSNPKIEILWNTTATQVHGTDKVEKVSLKTGDQTRDMEIQGFFLAIGHRPMTVIFDGQLQLDEQRYLVTRQSLSHHGLRLASGMLDEHGLVKFPSMTSVEGVFAAGDVVDVRYKQAITAAGQGCQAAIDAERWLGAVN